MLPKSYLNDNPTGCCPKFNYKDWDKQKVIFKDKMFVKDANISFFHIPLNLGQVMTRMWKQITDAKAEPKTEDWLMLSYDPSPWKTEQYCTVNKKVPDMENVKLSGTFITRVFEGPYQNAPKWLKETEEYVKKAGHELKKTYFFYTTCPKCAKVYGKNYVVVFGQIN
jgi:hypothetical protein